MSGGGKLSHYAISSLRPFIGLYKETGQATAEERKEKEKTLREQRADRSEGCVSKTVFNAAIKPTELLQGT